MTVVDPDMGPTLTVNDNDFRVEWFSGTGSGGMHRNKKQTSCRVIHVPTGTVASRQGRYRETNLTRAKETLVRRLERHHVHSVSSSIGSIRKEQAGSGMRGDKIRTYRFQDDRVVDHVSGKSYKCSKVMKGYFDKLWP